MNCIDYKINPTKCDNYASLDLECPIRNKNQGYGTDKTKTNEETYLLGSPLPKNFFLVVAAINALTAHFLHNISRRKICLYGASVSNFMVSISGFLYAYQNKTRRRCGSVFTFSIIWFLITLMGLLVNI